MQSIIPIERARKRALLHVAQRKHRTVLRRGGLRRNLTEPAMSAVDSAGSTTHEGPVAGTAGPSNQHRRAGGTTPLYGLAVRAHRA
jgi:hypothetical protein